MNKNKKQLELLFKKYNVNPDLSLLAKVQTLVSIYNCNYDYINMLYIKSR
jgi:hypothetical protein